VSTDRRHGESGVRVGHRIRSTSKI